MRMMTVKMMMINLNSGNGVVDSDSPTKFSDWQNVD